MLSWRELQPSWSRRKCTVCASVPALSWELSSDSGSRGILCLVVVMLEDLAIATAGRKHIGFLRAPSNRQYTRCSGCLSLKSVTFMRGRCWNGKGCIRSTSRESKSSCHRTLHHEWRFVSGSGEIGGATFCGLMKKAHLQEWACSTSTMPTTELRKTQKKLFTSGRCSPMCLSGCVGGCITSTMERRAGALRPQRPRASHRDLWRSLVWSRWTDRMASTLTGLDAAAGLSLTCGVVRRTLLVYGHDGHNITSADCRTVTS